jgi:UDP-glucose 4-epimerase
MNEGELRSWYGSRRVLVLGGLGFIGSHVTAALADLEASVSVLTRHPHRYADRAAAFEARGVRIVAGDVSDRETMCGAVRDQELVLHLACRAGAARSVVDPETDWRVNCGGLLAVAEAIRTEAPAARLVFAGSRLAYGPPLRLPVSEDHPHRPLCPHGVHQSAIERYLEMYGRLYGLRWTLLRITNAYGPGAPIGRNAYGVLNYFVHETLAGRSIHVYGDGSVLRDYVFVRDVVHALLVAGAHPAAEGGVFNVGSGTGVTLMDAAQCVIVAVGRGSVEHRPWPPVDQGIETGSFVADVTRIREALGWTATFALAEGLRATVAATRREPS